jgi:hypothetical protein
VDCGTLAAAVFVEPSTQQVGCVRSKAAASVPQSTEKQPHRKTVVFSSRDPPHEREAGGVACEFLLTPSARLPYFLTAG